MDKILKGKNKRRGISTEFAIAFKKSELNDLYKKHKNELLIGVRNNYLNLYYNCDSIAKIRYTRGSISCEIDKYYIDGKQNGSKEKEKRYKIEPSQIIEYYQLIKKHSDEKITPEKKAQSKLVQLNNDNKESNWFCIDVEYVKSFRNKKEKDDANFNGRFDIIAISKVKPHKVALIEIKYGGGAIGGTSGIYKHVKDFIAFCDKGYFEGHLKQEIIQIIKSQKELGISIPFDIPNEEHIAEPDFYFITLDNNAVKKGASTPKQTMAGYLFKDYRWDCKRLSKKYCVEADFGDITKLKTGFHSTFLFSKATLDDIKINDIIDGDYDERILPE